MNALERVACVLARARLDGGGDDEAVARRVLIVLGLDEHGKPAASEVAQRQSVADEAPPAPEPGGK